jgi:hypothetical protein
VIEHFRAGGPGWQARIDEVLRRHVAEARQAPRSAVAEPEHSSRAGSEED